MTTEIPIKIIHFDELISTNEHLKSMVRNGLAIQGEVIITDYQTGGKGQREKSWISDKGENLLFSI